MKKEFKTILTLCTASFILFSLFSCQKAKGIVENNTSPYYVKYRVDGVEVKYSICGGTLNGSNQDGTYAHAITGLKSQFSADKNTIGIVFSTPSTAVTGITYTNYATPAPGHVSSISMAFGWFDNNGNFFAAWGDQFASQGVISDAKLKFTDISASSMKGTFSGTTYKEIDGSSEKHIISDGEFYVEH